MNLQFSQTETQETISKPKIDIDTLVETNLPPSPDNVMRLSALLRDYNTPPRKISQALIYEPMLVTRILRLANSPIYSLERNVTSIDAAIGTVGSKALLEMVMVGMGSSTFSREIRNSYVARKIWEHSIAVAVIAREIAETLKMQGTEEAFTCGLLHDIGKLILFSYDFSDYSLILAESDEEQMLKSEREAYGYTHAQVGALVARRWGLPEEACYAINYHHVSFQSTSPSLVANIVEIADIMANIHGYGIRSEKEDVLLNSASVLRLRLTEEMLAEVWEKVQANIDEVIKTFV